MFENKFQRVIKIVLILDFSYFHVDFNMKFGYAHVVEKESSFDKFQHHVTLLLNSQEIMASILDLDKFEVLRPET